MKYQWLADYKELEEKLLYLKWNLNKSKLELIRWVEGDLAGVKLEKGSHSASLEEKIKFIEQEISEANTQIKELKSIVDNFEGVDAQIVKLKFIENINLDDIADQLGYSISYIRKRHTDIRKTLSFLDKFMERKNITNKMKSEIDYYKEEAQKADNYDI
ncbi:DUF1492 domain-containing protein [uncultured Enterococcus sp.]|uniref:DUF1492 domain-containing protein n=1 Tax=uncultured Enterococcus sp. TaxID=167972 RepID=UPI0028EC8AC8|nr:DUF1492 domain-containing protein [uncultured Enterococcus sp.]